MKIVNVVLVLGLAAFGVGCGYSKKATTPPSAGNMPVISQLAPSSITHGSGGFVLTVNGSGFNGNASINWNGTAQTTSFVSGSQLTTNVPAAAVANTGSVAVTVTNPGTPGGLYGGGTSAETSAAMNFTIN